MNRSRLALFTIAVAVLATACNNGVASGPNTNVTTPAAASPTGTGDEFAGARATYAKRCSNCHGDKGQGATAEVEGKKIKGPSLGSGHSLKHTDADFLKQIVKGGDGMPAFGDKLSGKEIDEMIRFIRHDFQGGNNPQASPTK